MSRQRLYLLVALTVVPVTIEAIVLRLVGFEGAYPLSPQVSAPPPFGIFHDMRWVFVYHNSWGAFAGEMIAAIVFRSLLNTAIVRMAWPRTGDSAHVGRTMHGGGGTIAVPSWRLLLRTNLIFNTVAFVALSPWAVVAMAASGTSLSWFTLGELLPVAVLALVLQRGGIDATWWRGLPSWRAMGWALLTFAIISLDAMVIGYTPGWWTVPAAAAAGAVNAWLWLRLVHAVVIHRPVPAWSAWIPVAPLVIALALGGLVALGQFATFGTQVAAEPAPAIKANGVDRVKQAVIYVAGYDSRYRPQRQPDGGLRTVHFSYRGLDAAGQPLPYDALATHQSLRTSARLLAEQVDVVHRRTGKTVALIGQSEGTLVVRAYLDNFAHPDVDAAIQFSPLVRPGRVYYPPRDASSGWGVVAGWELRGMLTVVRATSGSQASPDEPFVRSVLDNAVFYRNRMLCPVPGVRMIAFLPTASAVVVPPGTYTHIPVVEQVGLHASLLGRPSVQQRVVNFLNHGSAGSAPGPYYPVIRRGASAWQAPALALRINPVWPATGQPDASFGQNGCRAHPPWFGS